MANCCQATKCFQCCVETNMVLTNHDIETIQKLGYDSEFFVTENNGWLQLKNTQGHCVFHDGTGCIIYPHRPKGCTLYPIVFDKTKNCAILDNECPQRHCFFLSHIKEQNLKKLVYTLQKERKNRKKRTKR